MQAAQAGKGAGLEMSFTQVKAENARPFPKATGTLVLRPQQHVELAAVTEAGAEAAPCPPALPPRGLRSPGAVSARSGRPKYSPPRSFRADSVEKCHR